MNTRIIFTKEERDNLSELVKAKLELNAKGASSKEEWKEVNQKERELIKATNRIFRDKVFAFCLEKQNEFKQGEMTMTDYYKSLNNAYSTIEGGCYTGKQAYMYIKKLQDRQELLDTDY